MMFMQRLSVFSLSPASGWGDGCPLVLLALVEIGLAKAVVCFSVHISGLKARSYFLRNELSAIDSDTPYDTYAKGIYLP